MSKKYTARCACGTCRFEFNTDPPFIAICHCLDCKKASGGEAATFMGVSADDFTLLSGLPKSYGYVANSGNRLYRNFCPECGARIFTDRLEGFPGMVFVQLGAIGRSSFTLSRNLPTCPTEGRPACLPRECTATDNLWCSKTSRSRR